MNEERVLVVDDDLDVRDALVATLTLGGYRTDAARDVRDALAMLEAHPYALALVDVRMPGSSGIDLLHHLSVHHPDTAVVMVSAADDRAVADLAFEIGAYGYVIKPWRVNELLIGVVNALRRRELEIEARANLAALERTVLERTRELERVVGGLARAEEELAAIVGVSSADTIERLGRVLEARDLETSHHTERMSRYAAMLAARAGFDAEGCEAIRMACALHDLGKIGIPDSVLLKPGRLTEEELQVVRRHPDIGHRILSESRAKGIALGATIAWTHHERWDGSGYPRGLAGAAIPIEGRVAAVTDVFDALTSDRPWRRALAVDDAVAAMRAERGTHFDPHLLALFLDALDEALTIRHVWADRPVA